MNTHNRPTVPPSPAPPTPAEDEAEAADVIDTIAYIEMHRQVTEKEAGAETARREALRKLQEALAREQALSQKNAGNPGHAANVDALESAIKKLKTGSHAQNHASRGKPGAGRQPDARPPARNHPKRPRVRRKTGRHGGR